ncbi:cobyrinate a,c-diamide synthase [Deltaproteobacteria bacterium TL4]
MKAIMIAAPSSGSGKTSITMGLLRALAQQGLDVCAFKVGPDYIDRGFLEIASQKPGGNLDLHLQGEEGVWYALSLAQSEFCLIEGVMGYFDGIYNTWENSSYHLSQLLGIQTVLIYTPQGEMFSAIPKIKGMADFERSNIKAVIFNKVSPHTYELLKNAMESHTALKVLGFIPPMESLQLPSRHLGLVQAQEIESVDEKIQLLAQVIENHLDIPAFLELMQEVPQQDSGLVSALVKTKITIAIAKDQAFSFYYQEDLRLLEQVATVRYFSPLHDSVLPCCDLLYLGGGYPEVYGKELAQNDSMLRSIRDYGERGGFIYAECGGLMYLGESIDDAKMVGLFNGKSSLTPQLQRFGYIDIELKQDCFLGKTGASLRGHEFHKSITSIQDEPLFHIQKTKGDQKWECGYTYKNVIAGYPHISLAGNPKVVETMLNTIQKAKNQLIEKSDVS